jgi:TPR repeat protein
MLLSKAEKGDAVAQHKLGELYLEHAGLKRSHAQKAFAWFKRAADQDCFPACLEAGKLLVSGLGAKKNVPEGFKLIRKSAENYEPGAFTPLAELYRRGKGAPKSLEDAFIWTLRAAETSDPQSYLPLAIHYLTGDGTEKNFEKARKWLVKTEHDNINALELMIALFMRGGATEELRRSAAERLDLHERTLGRKRHDEWSVIVKYCPIGDYFRPAFDDCAFSPWDALKPWSERLEFYAAPQTRRFSFEEREAMLLAMAEKGDATAQYKLGELYLKDSGPNHRHAQAFAWFKRAADQDCFPACLEAGKLLISGLGAKKNVKEGFKLIRKSAENFEPDAFTPLADLYRQGSGAPKNLKNAFTWTLRAAENSDPRSYLPLAIHYLAGDGTEKNFEKALEWIVKTDHENINALELMVELAKRGGATTKLQRSAEERLELHRRELGRERYDEWIAIVRNSANEDYRPAFHGYAFFPWNMLKPWSERPENQETNRGFAGGNEKKEKKKTPKKAETEKKARTFRKAETEKKKAAPEKESGLGKKIERAVKSETAKKGEGKTGGKK